MREKICCIYCIELNKKLYIGQTVDYYRRISNHKNMATREGVRYKYAIHFAIKKHGFENCKFSILERCDRNQLNEKEQAWISKMETLSPKGYNLDSGGKQNREIAESTKEKLRERNRTRVWSEESREKLRKFNKGRKQSEETKQKRRDTYFGKSKEERERPVRAMQKYNKQQRIYLPYSEDYKKRLSKIHLEVEKRGSEAKTAVPVLCVEKKFYFGTISEAAQWCVNNKICTSTGAFKNYSSKATSKSFFACGFNWIKMDKEEYSEEIKKKERGENDC